MMLNMKLLPILVLLVSLSFNSFSQSESILWSEEYDDDGYYAIIGESSDAIFVERKYNARSNDRNVDIELLRFNQGMELTHAVELKDLERGNYESIATINTPEGIAHIYYQTTKKGEHFVSAQLFDHQTLRKTEIVDLAKFRILKGSQQMIRQDNNYQFIFPLDILLSNDKTKMAITFDQEKAGKRKQNFHQYCVIDLSRGFSILYQDDFYSDEQSEKYSLSDKHLSNSGKLTYALKRYVKNNNTEHINKQPAYDYEIHHMTGDTMEYIYDIKVRKEYIDKLVLGSDRDDNLYVAGFIRKQPFGDIIKSYFLSLDASGYERYTVKENYTKRDVKQITGKENDELNENFETLKILPADDIVYLVRQYRQRGSRNSNFDNGYYRSRFNQFNNFNNIIYHWNYYDVVVEGIGKETGEIMWTTVNPREQEDDDTYSRYFITGQSELIANKLFLIYNEREENVLRIRRKEDLKRTDIPGDRTSITIARVNSMGEIEYKVMEEEDYYHLPENGFLLGTNAAYFFYHHKNYRKFYVGKTAMSILDF
jgi:hypothetical protein